MQIGDWVTHPALPPVPSRQSHRDGRVVSFDAIMATVEGYPSSPQLYWLPVAELQPAQAKPKLLALHNAERARAGLPGLLYDFRLEHAAQPWAEQMAASGVLSHGDSAARIRAAGYAWSSCAENIAEGQPTPEAVFAAWMASPGHRANIMGAYQDVGFGRAVDARGIVWWVSDFGSQ